MSTLHSNFRTFSDCNEFIFRTITDHREFLVDGISIIKVIQIGIKVNYNWRSLLDIHPLFEVARRLIDSQRNEQLTLAQKKIQGRSVVAIDLDRYDQDKRSKNLGRYLESLEHSEFLRFIPTMVTDHSIDETIQSPNGQGLRYGRKEAKYAMKVYRRIASLCRKHEELQPFKSSLFKAAQLYIDQWLTWKRVLAKSSIKTCLLVCHYHNEGLIHACRDLGIRVIEVQHGVIMKSSVFYVYPKSLSGALAQGLFPDEIHVFGEYWRNKLLLGGEFSPNQIRVVGDVIGEGGKIEQTSVIPPLRTLLVTSQTGMASRIEEYLRWLINDCKNKGIPYFIMIKSHPSENGNEYDSLIAEFEHVRKSNKSLIELMSLATDHLSVFSMTMFSAVAQDIKNYSLYVDARADFINEMVIDGVTKIVEKGINIFDRQIESHKQGENVFFSPALTNAELWDKN